MWPFNHDQDNTQQNMSPELSEYYQKEKREQTIKTWLFGIATVLITAALVFILFLAGRWVIRKFQDKPQNGPVATQEQGEVSVTDSPVSITVDRNDGRTNSSNTDSQDSETEQDEIAEVQVTETLPDTGPTETLAMFMTVSLAAGFAHRLATSRQ